MSPVCECVLRFSAKLDWLTVLSENVSSMWVCPGIFCQTGLADSALLKCVQTVSVSCDFLNWTVWQCSLKMCPGCECVQAFSAKLDWLAVLPQKHVQVVSVSRHFLPNWTDWQCSLKNVSSMWGCSCIFCQISLADSALWKCIQNVSVFWHFLSKYITNSIFWLIHYIGGMFSEFNII